MNKPWVVVFILLMALAASDSLAQATIPVEPYVEVSIATAGTLSLFSSPDGGAHPFTQAYDPQGQTVDGTITIILFDDRPPYGNPVAYYPREDIWLMDLNGGLASCQNGSIVDQDTDDDGMTFWANPLKVGGHVEPTGGNQLAIVVSGWVLENVGLADFRINTADLNGDRQVNLTDVILFSSSYYGSYEYASDFFFDGVLNLSDVVLLARSMSAECP